MSEYRRPTGRLTDTTSTPRAAVPTRTQPYGGSLLDMTPTELNQALETQPSFQSQQPFTDLPPPIEDWFPPSPTTSATSDEQPLLWTPRARAHAFRSQPSEPSGGSSGELHVSSDREVFGSGLGHGLAKVFSGRAFKRVRTLRDRTVRDLYKLRRLGIEVEFPPVRDYHRGETLGDGCYGEVYRVRFNSKFTRIGGRAAKYLRAVITGQPYAGKYMEFTGDQSAPKRRLAYELEKHCMKVLADHPYIVSYKLAVSFGQRSVVRASVAATADSSPDFLSMSAQELQDYRPHDFVSYDRTLLVMELADCGSLMDFGQARKLTDTLALDFMRHMCSGMLYFHSKGICHCDAHWGNVLLFGQTGGQIVAKWSDFGEAVSRTHWSFVESRDAAQHDDRVAADVRKLGVSLRRALEMVDKYPQNNAGLDLTLLRQMEVELTDPTEPCDLRTAVDKYLR